MAKNFVAGASHPGQMEREGVTSAPRKVHSGKQAAEVAAGGKTAAPSGAVSFIVVTDSSKFNRSSLHKIIDTQRIDMIIVDEGIPADSLEGLRKAGVEVILVGELASSL